MKDVIGQTIDVLLDGGLLRRREIQGCSGSDIAEIQRVFGASLPTAYLDFMRRAGRCAGQFLVGSDFLYPRVLELRSGAQELLEENGSPFTLGPSDYVFMMHQGYQFMFFDCCAGDDPTVRHYLEPAATARETSQAFSTWLLNCAIDSVAADKRLQDRRRRRTTG